MTRSHPKDVLFGSFCSSGSNASGGSLDAHFEEELSAIIHNRGSGHGPLLVLFWVPGLGPRMDSKMDPKRDSFGGYFGIPEGLVLMVLWDSQMDSSGTQE